MREACARCHAYPEADTLPKERWGEILPEMATMPLPDGVKPLTPEELKAAIAFYAAQAPDALPQRAARESVAGGPAFTVEHFTPDALAERKIPAVAHLHFLPLFHAEKQDLLVSEMRSGTLWLLAPWAPEKYRALRPLARDLNYPVHVASADLDGNGRLDLLVAGLGGMNPGNETKGGVTVLRQSKEGKEFTPQRVATGLARVADVRAADLDGDGDLDLVASAFGWRGPGGLLLFEARGDDFVRRDLDPRDGFIHVEPGDLDGDGDLDLVALLSQEHEQVVAFVNEGELRFTPRVLHAAPHPAWGYSGLERVDLDGDGDHDLLLSNGDALDDDLLKPYHGVSWLENTGDLRHVHHFIAPLYGCERAVAGDVDGDGDLDVVAVSFLPQLDPAVWKSRDLESVVWLEREGTSWRLHTLERHRNLHPSVAVGDYDRDGDLDIAVGSYVWLGPDGETRTPADAVTLFTQR